MVRPSSVQTLPELCQFSGQRSTLRGTKSSKPCRGAGTQHLLLTVFLVYACINAHAESVVASAKLA